MAIADTINSIRTHLTEDYEGLENLGVTAEDRNIENIRTCLDELYNNIPKTTGEDTNLSLTTLKGKMNIIPKGDTQQNGTPTPSTPIDIEVVTGTQEVTISNSDNTETQVQQISLGDIELCKIGNYQDYLYKSNGKWYKKEYIYKIANKTNWVVGNMVSNNRAVFGLVANGFLSAVNIYSGINCISNSFIAVSQGTQGTTTEINNICINGNNIYIKFADTINTRELAKAQLDSMTNLEMYYVLATPNDIEITNETLVQQLDNLEKMYSYNGITNISSSGNLPIVLGVSALKGE